MNFIELQKLYSEYYKKYKIEIDFIGGLGNILSLGAFDKIEKKFGEERRTDMSEDMKQLSIKVGNNIFNMKK